MLICFDRVFDLGFFQDVAGSVALDRWLGVNHLTHDSGWQFNRNRLAVIEHGFAFHAIFEVVQGVAQILAFDFILFVVGIHEHEQRIGKVRIGHGFFVEHDDVELVIATEHVFLRAVGQKILHLPLVGEARAARTIDVGAQNDHWFAVNHDDVANTNFFCKFHSEYT